MPRSRKRTKTSTSTKRPSTRPSSQPLLPLLPTECITNQSPFNVWEVFPAEIATSILNHYLYVGEIVFCEVSKWNQRYYRFELQTPWTPTSVSREVNIAFGPILQGHAPINILARRMLQDINTLRLQGPYWDIVFSSLRSTEWPIEKFKSIELVYIDPSKILSTSGELMTMPNLEYIRYVFMDSNDDPSPAVHAPQNQGIIHDVKGLLDHPSLKRLTIVKNTACFTVKEMEWATQGWDDFNASLQADADAKMSKLRFEIHMAMTIH